MAKNVLDKELHYSLKQMRLQNLVLAGQCLADGDEPGAIEFLKTFMDSIPHDNKAYELLQGVWNELSAEEDKRRKEFKAMCDRLGYLEQGDVEKARAKEFQKASVRRFMSECQNAALSYDLILKE